MSLWGCASGEQCVGAECDAEETELSCEPGTSRCVANAVQRCDEGGTYGPREPCLDGLICAAGECAPEGGEGCTSECNTGEQRCEGELISECVLGPQGCLEWGAGRPCFGGEICEDGRCLAEACPADCTFGEQRCLSLNSFAECAEKNGCPAWGGPQPCAQGETCTAGQCRPTGTDCVDACPESGARACLDEGRQQVCVETGGCLSWSNAQPCPNGQRCVAGEGCVGSCTDACVAGEVECDGDSRRICEQGPEGCMVLGAPQPCGAGQTCNAGSCVAACPGSCTLGERRCGIQDPEVCIRSDPCPRFALAEPCPAGSTCMGAGECVGAGECTPGQVERGPCPNGCGERSRTCGNDQRWGDWSACAGAGVCRPGQSEACGNCGTRRCTDACQWGACEGQGVCAPGSQGDCGECGARTCSNQCTWGSCGNGDGTEWRRCNQCGWQFCCPDGDWCECAGNFPASCNGGQCTDTGACR
ncbi:MAG: hypothetical protein ACE366_22820 [Bradymonadia bacterium]